MGDATNKAVFLSYASQDAEAARKICDALRAAGVEVWFDADGGLEHGDEWDAKIRRQIKECLLFIPIISANTQARHEGYFRIEWELAAQRAMGIASGVPFILPVVIDDTREPDALVPDRFRMVQWTRMPLRPAQGEPGGEVPPEVLARLLKLWSHRTGAVKQESDTGARGSPSATSNHSGGKPALPRQRYWLAPAIAASIALIAVALWLLNGRTSPPASSAKLQTQNPNSIAPAPAAPLSEGRQLVLQARALIDDDWLAVRENFRMAEDLCERATRLNPADGEAWATSARASVEMIRRNYDTTTARMDLARTRAERGLQLAPESIEAGLAMAQVLAANQSRAEAVRRLRDLLARAPLDARVARTLAAELSPPGRGANPEATAIRLSHPAFNGRDPRPLMDEAKTMHDAQRLAEAEELMARADAQGPCLERYSFGLAYLMVAVGDLEAAKALLPKIPSQLLSEDVIGGLIAGLWLKLRDGDKALAALRRVPRDYLEDMWYAFPKAQIAGLAHKIAGRSGAAETEWRQALALVDKRLALQPNDAFALRNKAMLLAYLGRKEEAEKTWQLSSEFRPWNAALIAYWRGSIHLALGETEAAIRVLESNLTPLKPGEPVFTVNKVRYEYLFDSIRDDSRIQALITEGGARVRELRGAAASLALRTISAAPAPDPKSVAVLPFANQGGDRDQEYFSDGLTEDILNALARERDLRVPGRTSAFAFKGKGMTAPEIARLLNVAQVVEGSVQRVGNHVRIRVQITRASDGITEALGNFDRDVSDGAAIFALQDDVAQAVVEKLTRRKTTSAPVAVLTNNAEAYFQYLRGREHLAQTTRAWGRAIDAFKLATELDPGFALAWAVRGFATVESHRSLNEGFAAGLIEGRQAIEQALRLQPDLAEAHLGRASLLRVAYSPIAEIERALDLAAGDRSPNFDLVRFRAVIVYFSAGRLDEAVLLCQRAIELDPRNGGTLNVLGIILAAAGRYAEAEAAYLRAFELLGTNASSPLTNRASCYLAWKGDPGLVMKTLDSAPEAIREGNYWRARARLLYLFGDWQGALLATKQVGGASLTMLQLKAQIHEAMGDSAAARSDYEAALPLAEKHRDDFAAISGAHATLALIYAGLGRKDDALAAARRALEIVRPGEYRHEAAGEFGRTGAWEALAQVQARFGMFDEAVRIVQAQVAAGWWRRNFLLINPDWSFLQKDPRFRAIAEKAPL